MSSDYFARCGIMHHTRSMLDNTMCGREFIIGSMPMPMMSSIVPNSILAPMNSGFMMSQYLEMLFPTSDSTMSILDQKVVVDMQTAEKREFTAQGVSMQLAARGLGRRTASGNTDYTPIAEMSTTMGKSEMSKAEKRKGTHMIMGSESVQMARQSANECQGKTVKQLSRLWIYADGARPVAEGVAMGNGVDLGMGLGGLNGMV